MVTIFTPTYNRAHLLRHLYDSLCQQSIKDFEWVVVDDGSQDQTQDLMESFIAEKIISIRYIWKVNGGKHTAINRGVKEAKGELFWILDSDDSLPVNAIETVLQYYPLMKKKGQIGKKNGGICGYMSHHNGVVIGKPMVKEPMCVSSIEMRYNLNIQGDMMEIFLTSVLREFPFPEIEGERFCPEVLIWYRIAQKYNLLLLPKVIYYRDYLDGGLTDNIVGIRMKSPRGTMMTYSEMFNLNIPFIHKLRNAINYWRFAFCSTKRDVKIKSWGNLIAPIGYLMHLNDKQLLRK